MYGISQGNSYGTRRKAIAQEVFAVPGFRKIEHTAFMHFLILHLNCLLPNHMTGTRWYLFALLVLLFSFLLPITKFKLHSVNAPSLVTWSL